MYRKFVIFLLSVYSLLSYAQFNIERLMTSGQIALHYEDYVLSMQYFNQVISLKPYLYQAWQYRSIAKFYLDDYVGAEEDANEAISLNPYVEEIYDLRAISRIRQKKFDKAIVDYDRAILLSPTNKNYWYNRTVCKMNTKDYAAVHKDIDMMIGRWTDDAKVYVLNAETYLHEKDTLRAAEWLDKGLKHDPYDAPAWTMRAYISLSRKQWRDADTFLSKAIHLKPKNTDNYINRALARVNINNLRGAMADYDMALDLDPNNFLAHYNRGLLRMQLGDDNRAIIDFDYVIRMEPDNVMAILNRGILHDKTGNLRAAINDYTRVINQFPNFWTGLAYRARCYRRLGMTAKAELDEFKIFKAQMDKRIGQQTRWTRSKLQAVRKRSEIDLSKYNQMVVADENEVTHEYQSRYRGRVQDNSVSDAFMPMYHLSFRPYGNGINSYQAYDRELEAFNRTHRLTPLYLSCGTEQLTEQQSTRYFQLIDSLTTALQTHRAPATLAALVLQRAVAYATLQNFDAAIADLDTYISIDSTSALGYWHRAIYQVQLSGYKASSGNSTQLQEAGAQSDFTRALALQPNSAYLYFDRANLHAAQAAYDAAIIDYTTALRLDPHLAEAYYNRGLAYLKKGDKTHGIKDLSKAGELGLYSAYSIIKQNRAVER